MADESKYPTRIPPYGLRMPPTLKERVEASAKANSRSLHAEIIHALEEKYPAPKAADHHPVAEHMAYVREASSIEAMRERASERNAVMQDDPGTKGFTIRVLDDVGMEVTGQRVVLGYGADVTWKSPTRRPD